MNPRMMSYALLSWKMALEMQGYLTQNPFFITFDTHYEEVFYSNPVFYTGNLFAGAEPSKYLVL